MNNTISKKYEVEAPQPVNMNAHNELAFYDVRKHFDYKFVPKAKREIAKWNMKQKFRHIVSKTKVYIENTHQGMYDNKLSRLSECEYAPQSLFTDETTENMMSQWSKLTDFMFEKKHLNESFIEHYIKVSPDLKEYVSLLEDTLILMHGLLKNTGHLDRYVAIVNFFKLRGARPGFTQIILYIAGDFFGDVAMKSFRKDPLYEEICKKVDYEPQSGDENPFSTIRYYLSFYDKFKETAIYKKVYKFMLYILSCEILKKYDIDFKSCNFSRMEAEAIKRTHGKGFDMLHCILDTITFICERGLQFFKTGDINSFFHTGSSYEKWYNSANRLIREHKFLSNPEPHGVNRFQFISDLKDAIEKGTSILKFTAGLDKYEKLTIGKLLNDLQIIESNELTRKAAQMPRKDPFAVLIHGSSSICKSQLKNILFYHYGKIFGHPVTADYMYTRCPTDEYWSGFNSTQWCIVMDDIAFLRPTGEVDPTLKEMLQVKNSVPYCPPQAALEDKGRTPVRAELLIGTTNTKHLNLHAYFACPFAIARRLSYIITAVIKPEYSKNGIMADSAKIPETLPGEYMNIWNFVISVPKPATEENVDNQGTVYKELHKFDNIYDMLAWYISAAKDHEISQEKALRADNTMFEMEICTKCYHPVNFCECVVAQSGEFIEQSQEETEEDSIAKELRIGEYTWWFKVKLWFITQIIQYEIKEINFNISMYNALLLFITMLFYLPNILFRMICVGIPLCLLYKYIWLILAYYFQYSLGWYWKYKLGKLLFSSDLQIARFIFYTKGDKIHSTFTSARLKKLAAFCAVLGAMCVSWGLISRKKNLEINDLKKELETASENLRENIRKMDDIPRLYIDAWNKLRNGEESNYPPAEEVTYKVLKENFETMYREQGSVGSVPVPSNYEKPTFYYQDPYSITEVDISSQSKTVQGNILEKKIERNVAKLNFRFDDTPTGHGAFTNALNIKGTLWLLNKHTFRQTSCFSGVVDVTIENVEQNVSRNVKNIRFSKKDIICSDNVDLAIIDIRALPPGQSLVEYFPKKDPLRGIYSGAYTIIDKFGNKRVAKASNVQLSRCLFFNIPAYHGNVEVPTKVGECGSPLIIYAGNSKVIGGIHTSGAVNGNFFAQVVTQSMLEPLMNNYVPQVDCNEIIPISAKDYNRSLIPVHNRCTLRWVPNGTATMYGSFTGFRPKHTSKVKKTFIRDEVVKDGYNDICGAPDMSWKPWNKAILDMTNPNHVFDNSVVDECADAFFNDIIRLLPKEELKKVEVYTQDVALNGVAGVTFVDRLNIRTSAGNPYKRSKLNFITLDDNNKIVAIADTVQERINLIEETYSAGKRFHPQFCAHLKDEPTPQKKIDAGKTRVFTGGEFAWSVVVRRYLLSHIRLIQNNPYIFEAMPGIVAQSTEWTDLYNYLIYFGKDRIIAGDYGKFDKKMAAPFILAAFRILRKIAEKAKWSEEDLKYIDCIAYDTAFPCIDFNGDLIEIQGNPSGHPLTVIINCLVNSLYMRYAYKLISKKPLNTFKENVHLATYGDDNIMGVSKDCPEFNHTKIMYAMKVIGVEYTMAEKEAESIPYIHIDDSSFLKRRFVEDADLGAIAAPLDHSSIDKMLTSHLDNGVLATEAHSICAIETALREYFYYGKNKFNERRKYFISLIERCNLQIWVKPSTLPTYEQCAYGFWMRYGNKDKAESFISQEELPQGDLTPKQASLWFDSPGDVEYSC